MEYTDVFDENKIKKLTFSAHLIKKEFSSKSLFALIVDGKSMQPVIKDRALIVMDLSQKDLVGEDIYVVHYEGTMWVKKFDLENETFISINPDFSHLVYKKEEVHIVGKVLITFTNL